MWLKRLGNKDLKALKRQYKNFIIELDETYESKERLLDSFNSLNVNVLTDEDIIIQCNMINKAIENLDDSIFYLQTKIRDIEMELRRNGVKTEHII